MTLEGNRIGPLDTALLAKVQKVFMSVVNQWSEETVFSHPVLLSPYWHDVLRTTNPSSITHKTIHELEKMAERLREKSWPLGAGPLDDLFVKVRNGEIAAPTALTLAADPDLIWRVSVSYVRRMSQAAERWARRGEWRDGVLLSKLVLALIDVRRGVIQIDQDAMELAATVHWLDVARCALTDVPDGRIFRDAVRRGERLANIVSDRDGYYFPAALLHALGTLHLDPYVAGRTTSNYELQLTLWRQRFVLELHNQNEFYNEESMGMPAAADALTKSAGYLRLAAAHRTGEMRGWTLKALLQALVWQWEVGFVPPEAEIKCVGEEVKILLNTADQAGVRAEIDNLLQWDTHKRCSSVGTSSSVAEDVKTLLSTPVDLWLTKLAPDDVLQLYIQTANLVDANTAFNLWSKVKEIGWQQGEERRRNFCAYGMNMLAQAFPPEQPLEGAGSIETAFSLLRTGTEPNEWTRAAKLLALAAHVMAQNEEDLAIPILAAARTVDPKFTQDYSELFAMFGATLLHGAAVNHYRSEAFDEAAIRYMSSAQAFLACDCPNVAIGIVGDIVDLVSRGSEGAMQHFVDGISGIATMLDQKLPGSAEQMQSFYRRAMDKIASGPINPTVHMLLLEAAKGNALSRALQHGTPLAWLASEEAREKERQIEGMKQFGVSPASDGTAIGYELILSAYATPLEIVGGFSNEERLRNLMIGFEAEIMKAQLAQAPHPSWLTIDKFIQNALGTRSALLVIYIGYAPSGELTIFLTLIDNNSFVPVGCRIPGSVEDRVIMQDGNLRVPMSPFAPWVADLREALQEDPRTRKVSPKGERMLAKAQKMLLGGGLMEKLDALHAAGKDHLFVWPHGPFHFMPFHLIGSENGTLATQWNVTYLPSLQLLDPSRRLDTPIVEFVAFGLDFPKGNERGLSELTGAEAEAHDVAKAMNSPCVIVGKSLTKAAVIDGFTRHKRIHIATHGELPVSSPTFQTLYLSTQSNTEDLHAYEILRLNLRGVDLVTLSACETALGRIDVGDNLRGFSANLLIAGVSTIIGTLWPVETNCARFFFVSLYELIHGGSTKGEAFRAAQLATRLRFPQHRDWGAFCLTGAID